MKSPARNHVRPFATSELLERLYYVRFSLASLVKELDGLQGPDVPAQARKGILEACDRMGRADDTLCEATTAILYQ